ncbi:hypothetical protein CLOM_g24430 [Closterium sp. NIES-68]|nr:hypothetical protein CLOM_g17079 [Closterium sp. NIES-68]GJP40146.1 hypothetical protein CLOM_g24430 [Closterium sp. NIES-68]GJP58176.1 hypothetical protein CLOP_g22349 [Closterium sp. NIES-67]GJP60847.1 hypothetical protein CLOP_g18063 [Closterium sp. NIES-67]
MALTSLPRASVLLRLALALAALLAVVSVASAGRCLLLTTNTAYHVTSVSTKTSAYKSSFTLTFNVTKGTQSAMYRFLVSMVPSTLSLSSPKYYNKATNALIATFPCTTWNVTSTLVYPSVTYNSYSCLIYETAPLTASYEPVGTVKDLIDSGLVSNPSGFIASITIGAATVNMTVSVNTNTF